MISKIEMTVDFEKAKNLGANKLVKNIVSDLYASKDFASIIKKRIKEGENYRGDKLRPLEASTLKIRRMKGISSNKPLIETGNLLNSIKNVRKKNKVGISMAKYGAWQSKGFVTNNHFAVKKGNKLLGFRDYSDGVRIPPRPFIYPPNQIKKSIVSNDSFAGMVKATKQDRINAIKIIRKALKPYGKVLVIGKRSTLK